MLLPSNGEWVIANRVLLTAYQCEQMYQASVRHTSVASPSPRFDPSHVARRSTLATKRAGVFGAFL